MPERKRGAQLGNKNAMKHGRYSVPLRAARLAAVRAAFKERQRLSDEWIKTAPKTDYAAIVEGLRAVRRAKVGNDGE
jgi:hypothetical protein